jgi:periplasmic protein TonB
MAYADQKMSSNRLIALVVVAILHVLLGYGLISGLAYEGVKKAIQRVTTVDIEEEVKKEEEPPPPPPKVEAPPPPVAPPVKIDVSTRPPQIETVATPPPPAPIILAPPPAAPPPPKGPTTQAQPRGNPGTWATTNDYPSRALREERSGTTGFRVTVDTSGRVIDCQVTSSSGHADLDQATCQNVTRRARFRPAMEDGEPVQGTYSNRVRWVIPD